MQIALIDFLAFEINLSNYEKSRENYESNSNIGDDKKIVFKTNEAGSDLKNIQICTERLGRVEDVEKKSDEEELKNEADVFIPTIFQIQFFVSSGIFFFEFSVLKISTENHNENDEQWQKGQRPINGVLNKLRGNKFNKNEQRKNAGAVVPDYFFTMNKTLKLHGMFFVLLRSFYMIIIPQKKQLLKVVFWLRKR